MNCKIIMCVFITVLILVWIIGWTCGFTSQWKSTDCEGFMEDGKGASYTPQALIASSVIFKISKIDSDTFSLLCHSTVYHTY